MTITEEYEREVLDAFGDWCRQQLPTISDALTNLRAIAHIEPPLTREQVLALLQEHPDWIYEGPGITVIGIVTRHLEKHLENVLQAKGFQVVCKEQRAS